MGLINNIFHTDKGKVTAKQSKAVKQPAKIVDASAQTSSAVVAAPVNSKMKRVDNGAYKILLMPLITEKATDLTQFNKYVFVTPISATKSEVKKTVMNIYGVKPTKVNFIKGKVKHTRQGKVSGKTKSYKKAIVTLAEGDKIEIYEGV